MKERAISVRLDNEAAAALRVLTSRGISRSSAIRNALVDAARRDRRALAAEAAALAQDEADRREKTEVASLMESLRAEG